MIYEQEYIENLLSCEKEVIEQPAKDFKEDRGHMKKNFTLRSLDGSYMFRAFIRYNVKFPENFSIGLDYNPKEEKGTICLFRCNGTHGENKQIPHHESFHLHVATAESINSGLKPESNADITDDYASIDGAIQYFIKTINLKQEDRNNFFPEKQERLYEWYERHIGEYKNQF